MTDPELKVLREYRTYGYERARQLLTKLSVDSEITVVQRASYADTLAAYEMMDSKQRKYALARLSL